MLLVDRTARGGEARKGERMTPNTEIIFKLERAIREFERLEDEPEQTQMVARRLGNIVRHMKELRDDLRPRSSGPLKMSSSSEMAREKPATR